MSYIKLSDAKKAIMNCIGEQTVSKYATSAECKAAKDGAYLAILSLDNIPTADVVEVRHGEWNTNTNLYATTAEGCFNWYSRTCSECGYKYKTVLPSGYSYCPECGAKMDGKRKKSYYDAKLNNDCENCQRCHLICEEDNVCYREENNEKNTI